MLTPPGMPGAPGMSTAPAQTPSIPIPVTVFQRVAQGGNGLTPIGETDTHAVVSLQGGALVPLFVGEAAQGQRVLFAAHIFMFHEEALRFVEGSIIGLDGQPRLVDPSKLFDFAAPCSTILHLNKDQLGSELKAFLEKAHAEVASG